MQMKDSLKNNEYVGVLWAPIKHRWKDILENINQDGVSVTSAHEYRPKIEKTDDWHSFVINCYLSHEKIDNPSVNLQSKIEKIRKKLKYEHLDDCPPVLCVFTFTVRDAKLATEVITSELKEAWGYTDERIKENHDNLLSRSAPYELNIVKDIVRKRFCRDDKLPEYYKGVYAGRKRIMHTPVSDAGCSALLDFLLTQQHDRGTIEL